jgi:hypothetical protein
MRLRQQPVGLVNKLAAIAEVVNLRNFVVEDHSIAIGRVFPTVDYAGILDAVATTGEVIAIAIYHVDNVPIAALAVDLLETSSSAWGNVPRTRLLAGWVHKLP